MAVLITRAIKSFGLALLLGLFVSPLAHAQTHDKIRQGVQIGTPIPHQLDVPDQTNQIQSFVTLKKNRGLILIFSRSLSW
jgi:hypothetical protein